MSDILFHPPGSVAFVFHPFANLFPLLSDAELSELAADMRANGQAEPAMLHRGMVLDGRNRTKAAALAGIGVSYVTFSGSDRQALDYAISKNLMRRHLTTSQRAMVAAKLATLRIGDNQHSERPAGQGELVLAAVPPGVPPNEPAQNSAGSEIDDLGERASAAGHTVERMIDHTAGDSVGTCRCGAVFRVPRDGESGEERIARAREMDAAIEAHWHEVLQDAPRSVGAIPAAVEGAHPKGEKTQRLKGENRVKGNHPTMARPDESAGEAIVSQQQAADVLKVSRGSVQHAAIVRDKGAPELVDAVISGVLPVSTAAQVAELSVERQREVIAGADPKAVLAAAKEIRAKKTAEKREEKLGKMRQVGAPGALVTGKRYAVVYADPPWRFEAYSRDTGLEKSPDNHYPTMETHEIEKLPVAEIAADNSVLALWATVPMLLHALGVMKAWGYAYKSHLVWDKERSGTGYWFRNRHELLLIGTRGDVPAPLAGTQHASIVSVLCGEHSAKPEIFAALIEQMFPGVPSIELFRRGAPRPGWDAWGNQATAPELGLAPHQGRECEFGGAVDPINGNEPLRDRPPAETNGATGLASSGEEKPGSLPASEKAPAAMAIEPEATPAGGCGGPREVVRQAGETATLAMVRVDATHLVAAPWVTPEEAEKLAAPEAPKPKPAPALQPRPPERRGQGAVSYRRAPDPGMWGCGQCMHFMTPSSCGRVLGHIDSGATCDLWEIAPWTKPRDHEVSA